MASPSLRANTVPSKDYILWYRNYDSPAIRALVELSLRKTPEYGDFRLLRSEELSQGRVLRELSTNRSSLVDIANVATTAERETFLTPIPIPIDGGLLGFRVCLVMPKNLPMFSNIKNLDDLSNSNIRIGQGSHWPDTPVLQANGVKVITHTRFEILFGMIRKGRFECFARGVSEVLYDMEKEKDPDLVIEPNLLIAYPMPSYLFVAPGDHETAHRLQLGMERAIIDGSFAEFLKKYYGRAVELLSLHQRSVIVLDNPYLTEDSWNISRMALENLQRRLDILSR
ncbi:transporter substrate-binding domain-containing protein [Marinobacter salinexigens]|uniref:transporter substrate-binding domain-containing protein n=1 Tax=Marinobacter salinexigens TaxID=2919747 RepID=UPI001FE9B198|nr:transporter substrate-binding domain-containing protein [Marinobacter salinexigens]